MHPISRRLFLNASLSSALAALAASRAPAQLGLWEGGRQLPDFPIYKQPDGISCGPTCCSMVLGWYGIGAGIEPCKTKAGTRFLEAGSIRVGLTIPDGIENCLEAYGVPATVRRGSLEEVTKYIEQDRPPILLVRSGADTWHYVTAIGYQFGTSKIRLADPSGQAYWIEGSKLDNAWTYSHDLNGNKIDGRRCRTCGGEGKIAKGWTTCAVCSGSGEIKGFGFKTKCTACSGQGKWSSGGTTCVTCGGDGKETDWPRKAVELAKVSGHTLIVPDQGRPAKQKPAAGGGNNANGDKVVNVSYTIKNDAGRTVRFSMHPSERSYNLEAGQTFRGTSHAVNGKPPTMTVTETGRTYHLTAGDHKFWWMSKENRIGFDRSTD